MLDVETTALGARRLVPAEATCDGTLCRAYADSASLYFDNDHMSLTAARRLVEAAPAMSAARAP